MSCLSEWFKVHDHNHTIDCLLTHSEIKALSGDTKSLDGHRAYLGIVDEYHAHKTNQMYKLLEGGIKKLKSALISVITTAGLLVWSIANAKTISNNYGEIKIDKDITTERIDPIDAIIDAWKHAMKEEYRPDVNETVNEWLEQFEKYMKKGGEK